PGDEINLRVNVPAVIANSFISDIEVHPNDNSIIFITLSDYSNEPRIWRVDDADTDQPIWTNISGNLPAGLPCNSLVVHPDYAEEAMIVATDFGVYSTTNGGMHWVKEKQIPNSVVYQLRLRKSDYKVFVGTHGRGIWTLNFLKNPPISTQLPNVLKLALYPNPATDALVIPETFIENGQITIFDVNGKVMFNGEINCRELWVSNYPTGFYGVQIESESRIYSGSFIKN
ncbi:MAG: T9SS type A sorting domain-containing protein, partial [Bacteroidetes bacterium]|nr:T9SS type A sorting domain-containing protein [Bacteroidota bacterium]